MKNKEIKKQKKVLYIKQVGIDNFYHITAKDFIISTQILTNKLPIRHCFN